MTGGTLEETTWCFFQSDHDMSIHESLANISGVKNRESHSCALGPSLELQEVFVEKQKARPGRLFSIFLERHLHRHPPQPLATGSSFFHSALCSIFGIDEYFHSATFLDADGIYDVLPGKPRDPQEQTDASTFHLTPAFYQFPATNAAQLAAKELFADPLPSRHWVPQAWTIHSLCKYEFSMVARCNMD